ncbi:MAG: SAM-dependent methyltransferase [Candidatus Thiodiazotropha sp. (ex Myrtea spinifera)]|nr:SAM-dependent methyltransferase [Candidatus Thiodiazotropha sp. (ex Myrtea spinifera)]MCU7830112.1 SAM-dependent methyltransferase [Candidatus Thiodiazotropha sp. (ex Myrtea sp. 'scaly one' KF741663)]
MSNFYTDDKKTALEAVSDAQRIAFAPFTFQATIALQDLGILMAIDQSPQNCLRVEELHQQTGLSHYGIKVLLDAGLSIGLVYLKDELYHLTKTAQFILHDKMTQVNLEFTRDFCYQGLSLLKESVKTGRPMGMSEYGDGDTLYPYLSSLPEPAKSSWFNFDHFYSDKAFSEALPKVFEHKPKLLLDIGGNTGKWAIQCTHYDADVQIRVLDLPIQLAVMREHVATEGMSDRIKGISVDMLDPAQMLPEGADAIWMSQFLDCFAEDEILTILRKTANVMGPDTRLYILELFWDRQMYEAAAYSLNCTSLYFTCFANGSSRMYHSKELLRIVQQAGLALVEDQDNIGIGHTLLVCKRTSP